MDQAALRLRPTPGGPGGPTELSPQGGPHSLSGAGSRRQPRFRSRPGERWRPDSPCTGGPAPAERAAAAPRGPAARSSAPRSAPHRYPGAPGTPPAPTRPGPRPLVPLPGLHSGCGSRGVCRASPGGRRGPRRAPGERSPLPAAARDPRAGGGRQGHSCPAAPRPPPRAPECPALGAAPGSLPWCGRGAHGPPQQPPAGKRAPRAPGREDPCPAGQPGGPGWARESPTGRKCGQPEKISQSKTAWTAPPCPSPGGIFGDFLEASVAPHEGGALGHRGSSLLCFEPDPQAAPLERPAPQAGPDAARTGIRGFVQSSRRT